MPADVTAPPLLKGISSMATRAVLAELAGAYAQRSGQSVEIESVGGVEAARRVQAGESFDLVFLAADALAKLVDSGHVLPDSRVDLMRSGVSVAVHPDGERVDISSESALRQAVLSAASIGYSTGPSGTALMQLFLRWGVAQQIQSRLVQATPGLPVGSLVANGTVALGFQQTSELLHVPGICVLGPLPGAVQIVTTFSGGVASASAQPVAARRLLDFMAGPHSAQAIQRQGMEPI